MVKIIEKRDSADKPGDAKHVEYYVHYEAFNRRLDTWVSLLDFDLGTLGETEGEGNVGRAAEQR